MRRFSAAVDTRSHIPRKFIRLFATVIVLALLGTSANAAVTKCGNGQVLAPGNGGNLVVLGGVCTVNSGTYLYANVNIIVGGTLQFSDANIDFWAESILVENTGSLIAGTTAAPIGTNGSRLIIHLWGADQGTSGTAQGIPCVTPVMGSVGPCGIPMAIWASNIASQLDPTSCKQNTLPGGVTDCFYQYMPIDYDGGGNPPGYFGYKVLAVSYGGTLQLFGKKGATYAPLDPASSGKSWGRLNRDLKAGEKTLVLDRKVDWQAGDQIVLTTTDYLPGHSEALTISTVASDLKTIHFTNDNPECDGVCFPHNGHTYGLSSVPSGIGPDQDTNVACSSTQTRCVEMRAAVGLLTRSIQIVSGGHTIQSDFPPSSGCQLGNPCTGTCYFFGGHTLVRQASSHSRCREWSSTTWDRAAASCTTLSISTWRAPLRRPPL